MPDVRLRFRSRSLRSDSTPAPRRDLAICLRRPSAPSTPASPSDHRRSPALLDEGATRITSHVSHGIRALLTASAMPLRSQSESAFRGSNPPVPHCRASRPGLPSHSERPKPLAPASSRRPLVRLNSCETHRASRRSSSPRPVRNGAPAAGAPPNPGMQRTRCARR